MTGDNSDGVAGGYIPSIKATLTIITLIGSAVIGVQSVWPTLLEAANVARQSRVESLETQLDTISNRQQRQGHQIERIACELQGQEGCWR